MHSQNPESCNKLLMYVVRKFLDCLSTNLNNTFTRELPKWICNDLRPPVYTMGIMSNSNIQQLF